MAETMPNVAQGSGLEQNDPNNTAMRVPGPNQSKQAGEIAAIIVALQAVPHFCPLEIITILKYVIMGLTSQLQNWENRGWIGIENAHLFKKVAFLLRHRSAISVLSWAKGHNNAQGSEGSNKLAREGAEKDIPDQLDLDIPIEFNL